MNSYRARLEANQQQSCIMKVCERKRIHFSKYCATHSQRGYQYGDPTGRRIRPKEYEEELADVRDLIRQNPEHSGIQIAVKFFDDWLAAATTEGSSGTLASKHFYQLYQEGLTGEELLCECAAIYLFQRRNPRLLPDGLATYIALALGVLCKRKNKMGYGTKKYIDVSTRRNVGRRIIESIGLLLVNITNTVRDRERKRQDRDKAFLQEIRVGG
jgi:hypothetical protein